MYSTCGREPPPPPLPPPWAPGLSGAYHHFVISFSPRARDDPHAFLFGGKCVGKAVEMASNMPLPIPPRTPTPPSDDATDQYATQVDAVPIDRDSLSPLKDTFPKSATLESGSQDRLSPTKPSFNLDPRSADPTTAMQNGSSDSTPAGPFNFNTTVMAKGPVVKSVRSFKCC